MEPPLVVFVDSNLGTHMVMPVSPHDTVRDLKRKVAIEHACCFPATGHISVISLKVLRKGVQYHLSDSMVVRSVFAELKRARVLHVEAVPAAERTEDAGDTREYLPLVVFPSGNQIGTSSHSGILGEANISSENKQSSQGVGASIDSSLLKGKNKNSASEYLSLGSNGLHNSDLAVQHEESENRAEECQNAIARVDHKDIAAGANKHELPNLAQEKEAEKKKYLADSAGDDCHHAIQKKKEVEKRKEVLPEPDSKFRYEKDGKDMVDDTSAHVVPFAKENTPLPDDAVAGQDKRAAEMSHKENHQDVDLGISNDAKDEHVNAGGLANKLGNAVVGSKKRKSRKDKNVHEESSMMGEDHPGFEKDNVEKLKNDTASFPVEEFGRKNEVGDIETASNLISMPEVFPGAQLGCNVELLKPDPKLGLQEKKRGRKGVSKTSAKSADYSGRNNEPNAGKEVTEMQHVSTQHSPMEAMKNKLDFQQHTPNLISLSETSPQLQLGSNVKFPEVIADKQIHQNSSPQDYPTGKPMRNAIETDYGAKGSGTHVSNVEPGPKLGLQEKKRGKKGVSKTSAKSADYSGRDNEQNAGQEVTEVQPVSTQHSPVEAMKNKLDFQQHTRNLTSLSETSPQLQLGSNVKLPEVIANKQIHRNSALQEDPTEKLMRNGTATDYGAKGSGTHVSNVEPGPELGLQEKKRGKKVVSKPAAKSADGSGRENELKARKRVTRRQPVSVQHSPRKDMENKLNFQQHTPNSTSLPKASPQPQLGCDVEMLEVISNKQLQHDSALQEYPTEKLIRDRKEADHGTQVSGAHTSVKAVSNVEPALQEKKRGKKVVSKRAVKSVNGSDRENESQTGKEVLKAQPVSMQPNTLEGMENKLDFQQHTSPDLLGVLAGDGKKIKPRKQPSQSNRKGDCAQAADSGVVEEKSLPSTVVVALTASTASKETVVMNQTKELDIPLSSIKVGKSANKSIMTGAGGTADKCVDFRHFTESNSLPPSAENPKILKPSKVRKSRKDALSSELGITSNATEHDSHVKIDANSEKGIKDDHRKTKVQNDPGKKAQRKRILSSAGEVQNQNVTDGDTKLVKEKGKRQRVIEKNSFEDGDTDKLESPDIDNLIRKLSATTGDVGDKEKTSQNNSRELVVDEFEVAPEKARDMKIDDVAMETSSKARNLDMDKIDFISHFLPKEPNECSVSAPTVPNTEVDAVKCVKEKRRSKGKLNAQIQTSSNMIGGKEVPNDNPVGLDLPKDSNPVGLDLPKDSKPSKCKKMHDKRERNEESMLSSSKSNVDNGLPSSKNLHAGALLDKDFRNSMSAKNCDTTLSNDIHDKHGRKEARLMRKHNDLEFNNDEPEHPSRPPLEKTNKWDNNSPVGAAGPEILKGPCLGHSSQTSNGLATFSSSTDEDTPVLAQRYKIAARKDTRQNSGKDWVNSERSNAAPPAVIDKIFASESESSDGGSGIISRKASIETNSDASSISATLDNVQELGEQEIGSLFSANKQDRELKDESIGMWQSPKSSKKKLHLGSILRGTSSYKKAKISASQSQAEDSEDQVVFETESP